jgi:RNA polymerase sigma factor (sigma-70 family)
VTVAQGQLNALLEYIRALGPAGPGEDSDSRLLQQYLTQRDEAAFAGLVHRHGLMVLGVCRRALGDGPDAEDAFQATFLVLVRKAGSIRRRGSVASWLYGVAARVARQARISASRRHAHEIQAPVRPADQEHNRVEGSDLRALLDEELERLPEKYRAPLVLCYLEGRTHEEVAKQLGWPNGTVCGRLARGRELLRGRLVRRGVTLSVPALSAALTAEATAAVPASLCSSIIAAAAQFAAGNVTASSGTASAPVFTLAEGVLRAMYLSKLRTTAAIILILGLLGTAGVLPAYHGSEGESPRLAGVEPAALPAEEPQQAAKSPPQQQSERDSGSKAKVSPKTSEGGSVGQAVGFGCDGGASFGFGRGGAIAGPGFAGAGFAGGGAFAGSGGAVAGGGFGAGSASSSCRLALLAKEPVQRELKLTREQLKRLKETQTKQQQNLLGLVGQAPGNFLQDPDTIRKKLEELHGEAEKGVDNVLTTAQAKRLGEISLQQRGGHALSDSDVADALKLTEEQREQIETIRSEAAKELQTLAMKEMQGIMKFEGNPFDFQKAAEKMDKGRKTFDKFAKKSEELSKSTSKKLLDILHTEQKDAWKKLLGKPFNAKSF